MNAIIAFGSQHPAWDWLGAAALLAIVELASGSGWLLWPAGSAAAVGLVLFLAPLLDPATSIGLFVVLSIVSTYAGRRFLAHPPASPDLINQPVARLMGGSGRVAGAFHHGRGRVFVDGKEWAAEADGDPRLGAPVEVVAVIGGARLKVREIAAADSAGPEGVVSADR